MHRQENMSRMEATLSFKFPVEFAFPLHSRDSTRDGAWEYASVRLPWNGKQVGVLFEQAQHRLLAASFTCYLPSLWKPDHRVISQRHPHTAETLTNGARNVLCDLPLLSAAPYRILVLARLFACASRFRLGQRGRMAALADLQPALLFKSSAASPAPVPISVHATQPERSSIRGGLCSATPPSPTGR